MIAIHKSDYIEYGCPNCGCDFAVGGGMSAYGTTTGTCEECKTEFVICSDNANKSAIGFSIGNKIEYPEVQPHPRKGILKHPYEWPDPRPEDKSGEFWNSRGIGMGYAASVENYVEDCSGFIKSKKAGERLLAMIKDVLGKEEPDTWLDYRSSEPKWIQFKFLSTEFDLEKLCEMSEENNNIVTREILEECAVNKIKG